MKLLKNLMKQPAFVFGGGLFIITFLIAILGPVIVNINLSSDFVSYQEPGKGLILGADHLGRDMISMLIEGLRSSLYVGFMAGTIATTLGTLLGVYAGYKGGILDDIINMVTNLFLVIPSFVVLLLISASLEEGRSLELIAVIIGLTTWTWTTRSVRAQTASLKSSEHINLARVNGASTVTILRKHILPYLASYVFMVFIIQVASGILQEASISMLGLGPYDTVSLGSIMNDAMKNEALGDGVWWAFLPASALISSVIFALYVLNTSMEGVFNPALRK